jgi:hypothetical protein
MAVFNKFQDFTEQLIRGVHDFDAHVFKVALTNTAPAATDASWNTTPHPAPVAALGYPAGGLTTTVTVAEASGTTTVSGTQVIFTASGGQIGPFRYAVLYNDSAISPAKAAVGYWDYGASATLNDTETFTIKFNNASPGAILTLA